ncbi:hypothetical protein FOCC_FOCC012779 [Frankliniella occidentalis]|nr:hypothetical protein FOCC_FOCC012779 [Frankliniella occidentalis]
MPPKPKPILLDADQLNSLVAQVSASVLEGIDTKIKMSEARTDEKLEQLDSAFKDRTDELEQYNRCNNLRVFGAKESESEDTDLIVCEVAAKAGVALDKSCISRSHRVGRKVNGKNRAIIVKFVSFADRQRLFKAKKGLKGTGFSVREDLTRNRQTLLTRTSDHYCNLPVWTSDGVIIVKIDGNFRRLKTGADLISLLRDFPPSEWNV